MRKKIKIHWFILLIPILIGCNAEGPLVEQLHIDQNWKFHQMNDSVWHNATVPGSVHTDLLSNNLIKDPFYRLNEHDLQWIDKEDWEYKTEFEVSKSIFEKKQHYLHFKGLDTYADVYLNNQLILKADNMFRDWYVNCKKGLKLGKNELKIHFHSPIKKGLQLYDNYPYIVQSSANDLAKIGKVPGEKWVSPHVRKAPYHFGWDWGPRLVTSGIWQPIVLESWNDARIVSVYTQQKKLSDIKAKLISNVEVEGASNQKMTLKVLVNEKEVATKKIDLKAGKHNYSIPFEIKKPKLWWPNGLGEQHLYNVTTQLVVNGKTDDYKHQLGLREIEVINEKDSIGKSFYFKVNGQPLFMKGANYIPNDVFLDRVSPEKYEHIIKSAYLCNFNMLRVWGGGIYEKEIFYKLCDKYGILVWQDFMFACNMYPGDAAFLESVKQEAIYNVKRLRNHPSIAMWCGNNEILAAWLDWGWKRNNEALQPDGAKAMWKAYKDIFLDILPNAVKKHDPGRFYWASSPQASDTIKTSKIDGDDHDWRIWFKKVPFIVYHDNPARFVSEYGFQSFPELKTVKKYTTEKDYDIYSEVMKSHQRSFIGNETIEFYLERDYRKPKDFKSFLYTGLVLQAEGIKTGIEGHRINMPTTMGSLYWQFNDVWPVASWSSIDYYGNWKALQYFTKKAFQPIVAFPDTKTKDLLIYSVSDFVKDSNATLQLRLLDFEGNVLWQQENKVVVKGNTSNVIFKKSLSSLLNNIDIHNVVLDLKLIDGEKEIYSTTKYFDLIKNMKLPLPKIHKEIEKVKEGYKITVSTDVLAKNLYLSFEDNEGWFSDNYFDLLPSESRTVIFETKDSIINPIEKIEIRTIRDTY